MTLNTLEQKKTSLPNINLYQIWLISYNQFKLDSSSKIESCSASFIEFHQTSISYLPYLCTELGTTQLQLFFFNFLSGIVYIQRPIKISRNMFHLVPIVQLKQRGLFNCRFERGFLVLCFFCLPTLCICNDYGYQVF